MNKMDREVREPLDILDEIERELGMPLCARDLACGSGQNFRRHHQSAHAGDDGV